MMRDQQTLLARSYWWHDKFTHICLDDPQRTVDQAEANL